MAKSQRPGYRQKTSLMVGGAITQETSHPIEAVFRVRLADGRLDIRDEKGDVIPLQALTQDEIDASGIDVNNGKVLLVLEWVPCSVRAGGCVIKYFNGIPMLIW